MEAEKTQADLIKERSDRLKRTFKKVGILALILLVGTIIWSILNPSGFKTSGDGWEVISTESYYRDGKECMGYRVYVQGNANDSNREIANILSHDNYYQNTIWFYHSKEAANGSDEAFETLYR